VQEVKEIETALADSVFSHLAERYPELLPKLLKIVVPKDNDGGNFNNVVMDCLKLMNRH